MQMPIETIKAGLYQWKLQLPNTTHTGHVVVRGPQADPIGNWQYESGKEYWYRSDKVAQGATNPARFTIKLLLNRDPADQGLLAAIGLVRTYEEYMDEALMIPDWQADPPLPEDPIVFTEKQVVNGPGQYDDLYDQVSLVLPVIEGSVKMPTWYTSIEDLYSIFGGLPVLPEGIQANFEQTLEDEDGWPNEEWLWYGRDPS